jgi:FPC/CPF motif-containing protein YcgG
MIGELVRGRVEDVPVLSLAGTEPADWWAGSLRAFKANVGQRDYPCHFGRLALARGELTAVFFEQSTAALAPCLSWFLDMSRARRERRLVLAAFRRPQDPPATEREYAEQFWQVLQDLHDADTADWPADFPRDPEHSAWEFSFHGVPMFVFAAAPSYRRRASRNVGPGLVLLFQPRNVFAGIEGGTPRGIAARQVIRDRLDWWDTVPPHPDLGDYGDPSNHEWRQYYVPDEQGRLHGRCPLHLRGVAAPGAVHDPGPAAGPAAQLPELVADPQEGSAEHDDRG